MRTYFYYFFLILLPSFVIGQNIKGALVGGINATQVDGDEVYGYHKIGFNAGAIAIVPFTKNFSVSIETSYSQKGSNQKARFADSIHNGEYKLILDYVEVPVLFHYSDKDLIKVGTGFSWGKLVNFKEWENSGRVNWSTPNGPYKRSDVDVLIDLQIKLFTGFHLDIRYMYSVGKLRTRTFQYPLGAPFTRKQFNNDLAFRLIYIFKDSKTIKEKKKTDTNKIKK